MGMAASQARFLGLTARKTNVEYQGQQVNQARTVLANESAGLFNEMMALKVPTPPVVTDYYTSRYNFETGTMTDYTINSITPQAGSITDYDVSMSYKDTELKGYKMSDGEKTFEYDTTSGEWKMVGTDFVLKITDANDQAAIAAIIKDQSLEDTQKFMKYTDDSNESTYFVFEPPAASTSYASSRYYTASKEVSKTAKGVASFKSEETGRYTAINFSSIDPPGSVEVGKDYSLDITKTYDEVAYEQAMKNYDYAKMQYEQQIQVINAKTQKIQVEDRSLELKLRQLDTEQKALQTEMESVQKVIQKNVEVTFKTFA